MIVGTLLDFIAWDIRRSLGYVVVPVAGSILYRACITANPFPDPFMAAVAKITCNEMSNRVTSEAIHQFSSNLLPNDHYEARPGSAWGAYRGIRP